MTATFRCRRSSENSLPARWPSAADSRSVRRSISADRRRHRVGTRTPFKAVAREAAAHRSVALPLGWPRPSTLPLPPCCSSSRKSLAVGPPEFWRGRIVGDLQRGHRALVSRDEPLFRVPAYHLEHAGELGAYASLGVIGGFASLAFVKYIAYLRPRLRQLPSWTQYFQPQPRPADRTDRHQVSASDGRRYSYMDQAMHEQYTWQILAILGALKIVTTGLSFSSGTPAACSRPCCSWSHDRWCGGMANGSSFLNLPFRWGPMRWSAWARCSPEFCARP